MSMASRWSSPASGIFATRRALQSKADLERVRRVLIVGGGGREHALAFRCAPSPQVARVLVAPGNAGTAREERVSNVGVAADDLDGLVALARAERIDLTLIGPEAPLVAGIVDRF